MLNISEITSVLVSNSFNVPIFKQNWLMENGVLEESDFSGEDYFTPVAVNVRNDKFTFLVVPERIQLQIVNDFDDAHNKVQKVIGGIADLLPHCPVAGIGLNFSFLITSTNSADFLDKCKKLFVCEGNPVADSFAANDARFGAYYSTDAFDSRIRLDIKPVVRSGNEDCLSLKFNAHRDITSMDDAKLMLGQWESIYKYVTDMAEKLNNKITD